MNTLTAQFAATYHMECFLNAVNATTILFCVNNAPRKAQDTMKQTFTRLFSNNHSSQERIIPIFKEEKFFPKKRAPPSEISESLKR